MTYGTHQTLMTPPDFDEVQEFGKVQLEAAAEVAASFAQESPGDRRRSGRLFEKVG